jgi:peptidoglycan-associated lipoprotein
MKTWTGVVLVLLAAILLPACGGKRPPAVTQGPGGRGGRPAPAPAPVPVDAGPDVRSVENSSAFGEDITATSEGGPLADVLFDFDQAELSEQSRSVLEKHALWLQDHRDARVRIEGHCDERGTAEYNLALGDRRAKAAHDYLVSLGVGRDRLTMVSLGKEKPLDTAHTEAAWAKNRRDHFAVSR